MRFALLVFTLISSNNLLALQTYTITDNASIKADISANELNRIKVEEDRIKNIFGNDDSFYLESEDSTGQIFVKPTTSKTIQLSIITENEHTIDLLLTPKEIFSQTILLRSQTKNDKKAEIWETSGSYVNKIADLIVAMYRNEKVSGFGVEMTEQSMLINDELEIKQVMSYKGKRLEGQVWVVSNKTNKQQFLTEKQFAKDTNISAITLLKNTLEPGESTKLFMVIKNG